MDGHPTIRPFVLYRLKVAKHLCVEIRILHVLLVNSFSTLLRLHIKVYNAARASDALDNTSWIDRMDGGERTCRKSASTLRQMDRMLVTVGGLGSEGDKTVLLGPKNWNPISSSKWTLLARHG